MLDAVNIVLTFVIMLTIGILLGKFKWIDEHIASFLTKVVINVGIPCLLINNMMTYFSADALLSAGYALLLPFITISITYSIARLIAIAIRMDKGRRGLFCTMFAFSNTVLFGLPITTALFGESSAPYALFYFAGNTVLFWTIGVAGIRRDASGGEKERPVEMVKKIFGPPFVTIIVSLALVMLRVQLPEFIMTATRYVGNMCTPISLLYVGYVIYSMGFKGIKIDAALLLSVAGRFIISPLTAFFIAKLLGITGQLHNVLLVQAAMPVMTQIPIIAARYGADKTFAASGGTLSTVLSLVFLPIYMQIFSMMGLL